MKNKYIPLIVADALMFLAVFVIAYPNIVLMETMSTTSVLLCCVLVMGGMCLMLAPFLFEHLENKQKIAKDTKKVKYDIDLIFENLSALQLMIAETKEMGEEIEQNLAIQIANDCDEKFKSFQAGVETIRNNLKAKFIDVYETIEQIQNATSDETANIEKQTNELNALSEKLNQITELLDDIDARVNVLEKQEVKQESIFEQTQEEIITHSEENKDDEEDDYYQEQEPPALEQTTSTIELDGDNDAHLLDEENLDIAEESLQNQQTQSKLSGLMSKALGNAMSVASSVEKLIASSNNVESSELATNQQYEELNEHPLPEPEEPEQPQFQDYEIVPEQQEQYLEEDFVVDTNTQNQEDLDDLNFDDINFDDQQLPNLDLDEIIDEQNDIEEQTPSKKNKTSKPKVEQQTTHIPFDELFADVSVEKKRNLTKKDTAVTLHALIGIGNKPYLRSQNFETIPMEYVEIGVWRAILPQFEGEINFTIWENNEQQIGAETYSVSVGQKQEITI